MSPARVAALAAVCLGLAMMVVAAIPGLWPVDAPADEPPLTSSADPVTVVSHRVLPSPHRIHPKPLAVGKPERVLLPSLGESAPVVPITMSSGVLTPPGDPRTLGWWSGGAQPGAKSGATLITGHTVHTGGGTLDDLDRVRAGDQVVVETSAGRIRYLVDEVTVYRKQSLATRAAELFAQSGPGRLVLVTCEDWNGSAYLSNVVVVAYPV